MNVHEQLQVAKAFLKSSGIDNADREAELLISYCLGTDRAGLYKNNPQISENIRKKIDNFLKRRAKREPLQYILGYTEFYGLKIKLGPGVLIPRPETELLVEEALKKVTRYKLCVASQKSSCILQPASLMILDLCTGTGCIALALAKEFPDARIYGTDLSERAIHFARENADMNRIKNVDFFNGNLFDPIKNDLKFNLIISNPPYIKKNDINDLQPEVKWWEPLEALDGGEDGLDYYRRIIPTAGNFLKEHGYLMLEIGIHQAQEIKKLALRAGFYDVSIVKDFAGIDRIMIMNS